MGYWGCKGCRTGYKLRIFKCPRCHGTEFVEDINMPKITRLGGVSGVPLGDPDDPPADFAVVDVDEPDKGQPATPPGEDLSSVGDLSDRVINAPKRNATKTEWVKFAKTRGVDDADEYTRDELATWWESTGTHATKLEITAEAEVS